MKIVYYIHLLVVIFIASIPFLPLKIVNAGIYLVPVILILLYIIFDGCILNKLEKRSDDFFKNLLMIFFPNITTKLSNSLYTLSLVLIPTIIIFRILNNF